MEQSNRKLLKGVEVDLLIPDRMFAVEFNGLYWHSELMRANGRSRHHDKFVAAQAAGLGLFQVWEDDWRDKKLVVMRMLASCLGVASELPVLYPGLFEERTVTGGLSVVILDEAVAEKFTTSFHVESFVEGEHFGLKDDVGVLHAVLTTAVADGSMKVVQFASDGLIDDALAQLVDHAVTCFDTSSVLMEVSNELAFDSKMIAADFVVVGEVEPDYSVVVKRRLRHPRSAFADEQLAGMKGWTRMWDAGKTCYERKL